jgi:hypothetical protein
MSSKKLSIESARPGLKRPQSQKEALAEADKNANELLKRGVSGIFGQLDPEKMEAQIQKIFNDAEEEASKYLPRNRGILQLIHEHKVRAKERKETEVFLRRCLGKKLYRALVNYGIVLSCIGPEFERVNSFLKFDKDLSKLLIDIDEFPLADESETSLSIALGRFKDSKRKLLSEMRGSILRYDGFILRAYDRLVACGWDYQPESLRAKNAKQQELHRFLIQKVFIGLLKDNIKEKREVPDDVFPLSLRRRIVEVLSFHITGLYFLEDKNIKNALDKPYQAKGSNWFRKEVDKVRASSF